MLAECFEKSLFKPRGVGSAFGRGNNIDEAADCRLVANAPAQSNINLALTVNFGELRAPIRA